MPSNGPVDQSKATTDEVTVLPSYSNSVGRAAFGLIGVLFSAGLIVFDSTGMMGIGIVLLIPSFVMAGFGFSNLFGWIHASKVRISRDCIETCSLFFHAASFPWSEIVSFSVESREGVDTEGAKTTEYVVVAHLVGTGKFVLLNSDYYRAGEDQNGKTIAEWLEKIRQCEASGRHDVIVTAPDLLRIEGRN